MTQRSHSLAPSPIGQRQNARRVGTPDQARQRKAERGKERQRRRQAEDAERQRPSERVGVDEKRRAEPPQAGDKIAKAPPPARAERRPERSASRRRVARPTDPSISQTASASGTTIAAPVERRHRQRARRAADKGDGAAPPAPGENHALGETAEAAVSAARRRSWR